VRLVTGLFALGAALAGTAVPLHAQTPGDSAPAFTLKTLAAGPDSLARYRGHPVVVNFWATWCPPCRDEMPLLVAAYQAHQADSLVVLAVDLTDQEKSLRDVRAFVAEFAMPFPVLLDEKGKVRRRYKLRGVPNTVFIGADGVVRAVNTGPITEASVRQHLAEVLPPRP
jgi:thiol-disulfide isomerase/thioredoxin